MSRLKNKKIILMLILLITIPIAICFAHEIIIARDLKINHKNIHSVVGKSYVLKMNHKRKTDWESENEEIAAVDKKGKVTLRSAGETVIIAKCMNQTFRCKVVADNPKLSSEKMDILIGETKEFSVTDTSLKPDIKIDNDNILYDNGKITGVKEGKSTISVNVGGKEMKCLVTVKGPFLEESYEFSKGEKESITLTNVPKGEKVEWESGNPDILKVVSSSDDKVNVQCLNVGVTTITAHVKNQAYKGTVKVSGNQELEIIGGNVLIGESISLSVKNAIPSYNITWNGAEGENNGTAVFKGEQRGKYTITAIVDTGIKKEEVSKDICVLDKKLNITEWSGKPGESFQLTMQDGENVEYQYDESLLSKEGDTFTSLKSGDTVIRVVDGKTTLLCTVHSVSYGDILVGSMKNVCNILCEYGFRYKNNGCSHSLNKALGSQNYYSNCVITICYALQEAGLLSKGNIIYWSGGEIKGSGADELRNGNFEVTYPNSRPKDCDLRPGDICCFDNHMAVFAGYSEEGNLLWYSAGRHSTDTERAGGTYTNLEKIGPVRKDSYKEIECLIRPL